MHNPIKYGVLYLSYALSFIQRGSTITEYKFYALL